MNRPKLLFNPDPIGGGGAPLPPGTFLPTPAAGAGEVVGVITNDPPHPAATPATPKAAPAPLGNNAVPPITQSEHNVIMQNENGWQDPWFKQPPAPDPAATPAPEALPPQAPAPQLGDGAFVSPDGKWINIYKPHPVTGQVSMVTRVANEPAAISTYIQSQLVYMDQFRGQPQAPAPQQPAPPPAPVMSDIDIRQIASQIYGDDVEVGPIAEFGNKILEMAERRVAEKTSQMMQQQSYMQSQIAEYKSIQAEDPTFDLTVNQVTGVPVNPLAYRIMQDYPNLGARELHAQYQYWDRRLNPQAPPAAAPAAPAPQIRQPAAPQAFQRPNGSGGSGLQTGDSAYVQACVREYGRIMGRNATPQGAAQARMDAINLERAGGNQG